MREKTGVFILKFLTVLFIFLLPLACLSQELPPIQTDRPDQTESPFIVPKKHLQVETGFLMEKINRNSKAYQHPSILIKYGVNENFELRLIPEYVTTRQGNIKHSGLSPVTIGLKVKMADEKGILPMLSFIGHLATRVASQEFKTTSYAPAFRFTLQHTLSRTVSLGYNLGEEWDGESAKPTFIYTLSAALSVSNNLGSYVEVYGFLNRDTKPDHRVNGGFTYLISNNFMVDLSGGVGITKNAPEYFIATGFSFRLKD